MLTQLINDGDLCSVVFLICLLIPVGRMFIAHDSRLANWGLRVAAGTAILFAGATLMEEGISEAGPLVRVVVRSLAAGALILGPTWIVLSVVAFVHAQYQRLANSARSQAAVRKREREREREEKQREANEREQQRKRDADWERTRPERERAAEEAAERTRLESERKQQEVQLRLSDRMRREDAKLQCVLVYDRNAAALAKPFPRERLDQYFAAYMSETHPADAVETRAKQLIAMLEELATEHGHRSKAKFQSLADVAAYFHQQREQIQSLPYGPDVVESLVVLLNQHEDAAIANFLRTSTQ